MIGYRLSYANTNTSFDLSPSIRLPIYSINTSYLTSSISTHSIKVTSQRTFSTHPINMPTENECLVTPNEICEVSKSTLTKLPMTQIDHCGHCSTTQGNGNRSSSSSSSSSGKKSKSSSSGKNNSSSSSNNRCQNCGFMLRCQIDYGGITDTLMYAYLGAVMHVDEDDKKVWVRILQDVLRLLPLIRSYQSPVRSQCIHVHSLNALFQCNHLLM